MLALFVSRLTVLSLIVILFPVGKNIQYFIDSDHFLEECTHNIHQNNHNINQNHGLLQYPCFYLELWMDYNNGDVYDKYSFLNTFCTITIICISLYIVTSVIAVYGIVYENSMTLLPWIFVNIAISMFLIMMQIAEVYIMRGENYRPTEKFLVNMFSIFYLTFNWIVGSILISKIKRHPKHSDNESAQITYLELQNLHEDT